MKVEFGVFDHMDRGGFAVGELYRNRLRLVETYDRAGFYAYHLAEHHATSLGMAPSPSVFLSAVATRTQRLRFGPMVYVLPVHDPLRLIEEICMLDQLSGGRFELGVGRGSSPYEIAYFGVNHMTARVQFQEALEIIRLGLQSPRLSYDGKHYQYVDVPMILSPVQKPHPPLWYGLVRAEGAVWAAENQVNVLVNGPVPRVRPLTDRYRAEWKRIHGGEPKTKIGLSRHIHIADTDEEAHDNAKRAYEIWYRANDELWRAFGAESLHFPSSYAAALERGQLICGAPDTVRAWIARDLYESGANYLVCRLAFGDLTLERVERCVTLLRDEVMPAFRGVRQAAAE
jgi:alkanesulfonate monooxygenase SsuD/methylene tetrahydromethanopterin reductase-like flavin-dependent oxidoreductase (luciferase family)